MLGIGGRLKLSFLLAPDSQLLSNPSDPANPDTHPLVFELML